MKVLLQKYHQLMEIMQVSFWFAWLLCWFHPSTRPMGLLFFKATTIFVYCVDFPLILGFFYNLNLNLFSATSFSKITRRVKKSRLCHCESAIFIGLVDIIIPMNEYINTSDCRRCVLLCAVSTLAVRTSSKLFI